MFPLRHSKCQNRENCTGPGCKVKTGKTLRKSPEGKRALEAARAQVRVSYPTVS